MGTVTKALGLLDHFSTKAPQLGLSDFQRLTGFDKATVYRHLSALCEMGFVEQDSHNRAYRLGPSIIRLAHLREQTRPVRDIIAPIIDQLAETLGELVHASLLHGATLSSVYHTNPNQYGLKVDFEGFETLPMHASASGHAAMAFSEPVLLEEVIANGLPAITQKAITSPEVLRSIIERARQKGFSQCEEAVEIGVSAYAVPLFDADGQANGALATAFPVSRATDQHRQRIVRELVSIAPEVSERLGGKPPASVLEAWS
ncbi:MAG: IclR family transcriptional regulator [Pseudomonadota bacterium]